MNAIQIKERIDFYLDTTRSARYPFSAYNDAVNDVIEKYIEDLFGDMNSKNIYGFEVIQQVRDKLFTLIATATPAITTGTTITTRYDSFIPNHIAYPADYFTFVALQPIIDGYTVYTSPTDYNEIGPLLEDSFRKPSNVAPVHIEDSTGVSIYRDSSGTITSATLTYIKAPAIFTIGTEANLIDAGAGVLTAAASYIATEISVHNSITYPIGTQFTAANTNLTSGQVILASLTTTCDLPEKTHNDIAKMAAAVMSGVTSDFNRSAFVEKQSKEN